MKLISVVIPCFNEEENVGIIHEKIAEIFQFFPQYNYEYIFIDNASSDSTVEKLKNLAQNDKRVKIIVNARNFGHIRSPYHAIMQAKGDAVISMACDLQDPPDLIKEFIKKWEEGYKIVVGVKNKSDEASWMFMIRKFYYFLVKQMADSSVEPIQNYTGFGLYDKKIIEILSKIKDSYPFLRSNIAEIGFEKAFIEFRQPVRKRGFSKNSFYILYDAAMLGITSHSRIPLRLSIFTGFIFAALSLFAGLWYFFAKLLFWKTFSLGLAPIIIGLFFFSSVQLFSIGMLGEYVGLIYLQTLSRPLVIEKERINFD